MMDNNDTQSDPLDGGPGIHTLTYYVIVVGVVEPTTYLDGDALITPLETHCLTLELGRAFANLGLDPVFANTFSASSVPRVDLMSIHGVWDNMSKSDKATLRLLSPSLAQAIELIAPSEKLNAKSNGHSQDPEYPPATVKESSDRYFHEDDLLCEE